MAKKKTHDEFVNELFNINPNIEVLGEYVNTKTNIQCRCKITGTIWYPTPDNLLHGKKCPVCALNGRIEKRRKSHQQFVEEMSIKQPTMIVDGIYQGAWIKVQCTCTKCGHTDMYFPANLLYSGGCNRCYGGKISEKLTMSKEVFIEKLLNITNTIEYIDGYISASERVDVKCKICGHKWSPIAKSLLVGTGCPSCSLSHGEKRISKYLKSKNVNFIPQKDFPGLVGVGNGPLTYDFYLPEYNLLIEYQGEYHDGSACQQTILEFQRQQEHDKRKRDYTKAHNINLLEIWYWDFDNIEKILDDKLTILNYCTL